MRRGSLIYLHGFASGPQSKKGLEFDAYFTARGYHVERLSLRVPSFEHLRLSAMLEVVRDAIDRVIDRAAEPVVLIGSSLGGLTVARVAENDDRVRACVLLAPAFQLVERWKQQLGAEWDTWRQRGTREVADYTTGGMSSVDFGFVEDVARIDVGYPNVRQPTLVMHGIDDDVVPIERARTFAAGKPHVRLIELADGHELIASLPRLLAESDAFLAGLGL